MRFCAILSSTMLLAGLGNSNLEAAPALPPAAKTTEAPAPAGTVPHLLALQPGKDGKVRISVTRTEQRALNVAIGGGIGAVPARQQTVNVRVKADVELGDVKELTIQTTGGKTVSKEDAVKRLASGGVVIVSGDGKPVDPGYLSLFKDNLLVLVSPELVTTPARTSAGITINAPVLVPGVAVPALPLAPAQAIPLPVAVPAPAAPPVKDK